VDDEIRCYLTVYPLNSAPPYVALSYVWGVAEPPSFIDLGKSPFKVGPNLNVALKRLQDWDAKENYWIDALCIDQENVEEKNAQVQLMGKIYSRCKYVFIWLGEDSTNSAHDALSFIRRWGDLDRLMEIIRPYKPEGVVAEDIYERTIQTMRSVLINSLPALTKISNSLVLEKPFFKAVIQLLEQPYWQRVWILQEIILSRKAIVFYGNQHLEWQYFKLCHLIISGVFFAIHGSLYHQDSDELRFYSDIDKRTTQSIGARTLWFLLAVRLDPTEVRTLRWLLLKRLQIFTTAKSNQEITDLEWLLVQTASYQASNPRDKLYALLGLDKQQIISIRPEYKRSLGQVYADFVRGALCMDKLRLCGTNGVGYKKQKPSSEEWIPSWVPDLRPFYNQEQVAQQQVALDLSFDDLVEFGGCESIERLRRMRRCQAYAAGDSKPSVIIYDDSLLLKAKGVAIDYIEAFERPEDSRSEISNHKDAANLLSAGGLIDTHRATEKRWQHLVRDHCNVSHPTGLPRWQAYFRTLILDSDQDLSEKAAGFLAFFKPVSMENLLKLLGIGAESSSSMLTQYRLKHSQKGPAWLRRFEYILQFLQQDGKLQWLLHFLIESGEIDSIIDRLGADGYSGSFPPLSTRMLLQGFYGPVGATPSSDLKYLAIGENEQKYVQQYTDANTSVGGRCLFVTPRGYIGVGPPKVQKGDKICVLLGCDIPLIIRPVGDYYIVVGDCFVYGIMKGEVMKDIKESKLNLETFTLH
jgi:hypothetical protein